MSLSIGETAEILGVSVKTVRRWTDSGKLKSVRSPSGHRRFNLADVLEVRDGIFLTLNRELPLTMLEFLPMTKKQIWKDKLRY